MVSHQLVYVTGMLEVILGLSDPSGGSKRVAELSEASEGVRDVGQVCRVPGKLRRRPQPPRSHSAAASQIGLSVYICRHHLRTHQ